MSAVCSSAGARNTPKLAGGWASRSTSLFSETIWSRASRSVAASRSLLAAVVRASDRASASRRSSMAMSCGCEETRSRSRSSSSVSAPIWAVSVSRSSIGAAIVDRSGHRHLLDEKPYLGSATRSDVILAIRAGRWATFA